MNQGHFLDHIRSSPPEVLAKEFLQAETVCIFSDSSAYKTFQARVSTMIGSPDLVAIVGSGNWGFSLNPDKNFREFGDHSDVDVAIISSTHFHSLWEEMRLNHRKHYYRLPLQRREWVRRNAENVYAGFISPNWIPNRTPQRTYDYKRVLDSLSDQAVNFLKVKMMFFKNIDETIDYYARGFRMARRSNP